MSHIAGELKSAHVARNSEVKSHPQQTSSFKFDVTAFNAMTTALIASVALTIFTHCHPACFVALALTAALRGYFLGRVDTQDKEGKDHRKIFLLSSPFVIWMQRKTAAPFSSSSESQSATAAQPSDPTPVASAAPGVADPATDRAQAPLSPSSENAEAGSQSPPSPPTGSRSVLSGWDGFPPFLNDQSSWCEPLSSSSAVQAADLASPEGSRAASPGPDRRVAASPAEVAAPLSPGARSAALAISVPLPSAGVSRSFSSDSNRRSPELPPQEDFVQPPSSPPAGSSPASADFGGQPLDESVAASASLPVTPNQRGGEDLEEEQVASPNGSPPRSPLHPAFISPPGPKGAWKLGRVTPELKEAKRKESLKGDWKESEPLLEQMRAESLPQEAPTPAAGQGEPLPTAPLQPPAPPLVVHPDPESSEP